MRRCSSGEHKAITNKQTVRRSQILEMNFTLILDNSLYEDCFVEEQRLNLVEESPKLA